MRRRFLMGRFSLVLLLSLSLFSSSSPRGHARSADGDAPAWTWIAAAFFAWFRACALRFYPYALLAPTTEAFTAYHAPSCYHTCTTSCCLPYFACRSLPTGLDYSRHALRYRRTARCHCGCAPPFALDALGELCPVFPFGAAPLAAAYVQTTTILYSTYPRRARFAPLLSLTCPTAAR